MVYVVGVPSAHMAIGTSAIRRRRECGGQSGRPCAAAAMCSGAARPSIREPASVGAFLGSTLGKAIDGQKLLLLFALLMILVGVMMLRKRNAASKPDAACTVENAPKTVGYGAATGAFSGFFGIGGGFLIVPGLVASTGMPMLNAIGSSLVAVTAFGATTAVNYAWSGLVDWPLAAVFVFGGATGGIGGAMVARRMASRRGLLNSAFALMIFAVAIYMIWRSASAL